MFEHFVDRKDQNLCRFCVFSLKKRRWFLLASDSVPPRRDYRNPEPESIWEYCHGAFGFHCWKKYLWIRAFFFFFFWFIYVSLVACLRSLFFACVTLIFKSYQFRVLASCLNWIPCFMENASIISHQQSFSSIPCFIYHLNHLCCEFKILIYNRIKFWIFYCNFSQKILY